MPERVAAERRISHALPGLGGVPGQASVVALMTDRDLQRAVSLHRQFGAQHPGRSAAEPLGPGQVPWLQRRQSSDGIVHPYALALLEQVPGSRWTDPRSKSWDEFAQPGAADRLRLYRLRQRRRRGLPVLARPPDDGPLGRGGSGSGRGHRCPEAARVSAGVQSGLESRIKIFTSLPLQTLSRIRLQERVDEIGKIPPNDVR